MLCGGNRVHSELFDSLDVIRHGAVSVAVQYENVVCVCKLTNSIWPLLSGELRRLVRFAPGHAASLPAGRAPKEFLAR